MIFMGLNGASGYWLLLGTMMNYERGGRGVCTTSARVIVRSTALKHIRATGTVEERPH